MKLGNGSTTNGKCILKKSLLALFQAIIEYFSDWTYTTKKMNFEKLLDIKFAKKFGKKIMKKLALQTHIFSADSGFRVQQVVHSITK